MQRCACGAEKEDDNYKTCLKCRNRSKTWAKDHRKEFTKRVMEYRKALKLTIIQRLGGKCAICGYHKNYAAFDLHHKDPRTKEGEKDWRRASILQHLEKYLLVCRTCHAEIHHPEAIIAGAIFEEFRIGRRMIKRMKVVAVLKENPEASLSELTVIVGYHAISGTYGAIQWAKEKGLLEKKAYGRLFKTEVGEDVVAVTSLEPVS